MMIDYKQSDSLLSGCQAALEFCQILRRCYLAGQIFPNQERPECREFERALDVAEFCCQKALKTYYQATAPKDLQ